MSVRSAPPAARRAAGREAPDLCRALSRRSGRGLTARTSRCSPAPPRRQRGFRPRARTRRPSLWARSGLRRSPSRSPGASGRQRPKDAPSAALFHRGVTRDPPPEPQFAGRPRTSRAAPGPWQPGLLSIYRPTAGNTNPQRHLEAPPGTTWRTTGSACATPPPGDYIRRRREPAPNPPWGFLENFRLT